MSIDVNGDKSLVTIIDALWHWATKKECAAGRKAVWIPTSATRERSGFASISSCAIRESVRARPSLSRRTFSGETTPALRAQPGSAVCGQAASFDSFPASLDRLKGVRSRGTLSARPDGGKAYAAERR